MYSVKPCSANPMLVVFLLDASGSMAEIMPESGMKKSEVLATVVNKTLRELCVASVRHDGIKHYYDIAVAQYSEDAVSNALSDIPALREKMINSIVDVESNTLRVETRTGKKFAPATGEVYEETTSFPVWIEAKASGGTPMASALQAANDLAASWIAEHPNAHPPVVINVTDGVATDGGEEDLERLASNIKSLSTSDGQTVLMNLHISSADDAKPLNYIAEESDVTNHHARLLWRMSSEIPAEMLSAVNCALGDTEVRQGSRFVTFNGAEVDLAKFIEVGTRATVPSNDAGL